MFVCLCRLSGFPALTCPPDDRPPPRSTRDELPVGILCFNLETMHVTWNAHDAGGANLTFIYRFAPEPFRPCPSYMLRGGLTAGCVFPARLALLDFSLLDGNITLLNEKHFASQYLQPRAPSNVSFTWRNDGVTVTCTDLPLQGLRYEVQHRSAEDPDWQSREENTCDITVPGLDSERCYDFRARVTTRPSIYGADARPSSWTDVTHWRGARRTESCTAQPAESAFPALSVALGLLTALGVLGLCALARVWKRLLPGVPDPKCSFPGLFDQHDGNFQEWISDTERVAPLPRDGKGQDGGAEEVLLVQLCDAEAQPAPQTEVLCAQSLCLPRRGAQPGDAVALGGFTFLVNEDAYMVL
ncbi:cytokine receptor-like factor 2 [Nannospalax galili]|uniref:cytokine receptor-like factor 2 n=1 Tax=Nannospalax galili TaxID=1026970 RepID=UPI0004ED7198|nr:cytokine receptor-like factor 2 [Nannospalax galili]